MPSSSYDLKLEQPGTSTSQDSEPLVDDKSKSWCPSKLVWAFFFAVVIGMVVGMIGIIVYMEGFYKWSFPIRVECSLESKPNYVKCIKRGCIFVTTDEVLPKCFFPDGYGYTMDGPRIDVPGGFKLPLKRKQSNTVFGEEFSSIEVDVNLVTNTHLRVKIAPQNNTVFRVPLDIHQFESNASNPVYDVRYTNDKQFGIQIIRNNTGKTIFDTSLPGMILSKQFNQISIRLPTGNLYGFGEHAKTSLRHDLNWKKWSFFSADNSPDNDEMTNLHGVHPFYLVVEDDRNVHGVFLLNSNAMDVVLQPSNVITFRTTGGIFDFFIFLGKTPDDVVQQFLSVIGYTMFPPYWSLGLHLSQTGFNNASQVLSITRATKELRLPLAAVHIDTDYMQDNKSLVLDTANFGDLRNLVTQLHQMNVRTVLQVDPYIQSEDFLKHKHLPANADSSQDIFIKMGNSSYEGLGHSRRVYYPDYSHPESERFWATLLQTFYNYADYDGILLENNQPVNEETLLKNDSFTPCEENEWNNPPFQAGIQGKDQRKNIYSGTICMDTDQHLGKHYDLHNLYGHMQSGLTWRALQRVLPKKRPFVMSSSTFLGTGKYAGHQFKNIPKTWEGLHQSLIQALEFSMFGIPLVGANTCSFPIEIEQEELCIRWHQVGAFYPLAHTVGDYETLVNNSKRSEKLLKAIVQALEIRYKLLPYLYTLFYEAATVGSTVVRPLFYEFFSDTKTLDIDSQFLWGAGIMISPALLPQQKTVKAYFPFGNWYDFYSGELIKGGSGVTREISASQDKVNVHVRGGFIIPLQEPESSTAESVQNRRGLFIAPDDKGKASGILYWDDGEEYSEKNDHAHSLTSFTFNQVVISNVLTFEPLAKKPIIFDFITICNQKKPSAISYNGRSLTKNQFKYDEAKKVLHLHSMNIEISDKEFAIRIDY